MMLGTPIYTYYLHIDVDGWEPPSTDYIKCVLGLFNTGIKYIHYRVSPSGNYHIVIKLTNPVDTEHTALIEALLGSDLIRSCLIDFRQRNGFYLDTFFRGRFIRNQTPKRQWTCRDVEQYMQLVCPRLIRYLVMMGVGEPCRLINNRPWELGWLRC